ncbi:MAG TPA: hypothetical protein VL335_02260 [Candidatus Paceibacterota bacterium]|nr:hypothetical protein [Candidatus Paceibacterota bacterium]
MHKSPHLDEILAYYLLMVYGGLNAYIRFVDKDISGSEEEHDRNGILPIGCGENCRFNEHRSGIERIKGQCATTLVAAFLWPDCVPNEIKQLIAEVLECDTKAGCSPTQLADLVKVCNRSMKGNDQGVIKWAMLAIQAIIWDQQYHFAGVPGEKTLIDHLKLMDVDEQYLKSHFSADKRVREHMFRIMHESMKASEGRVTELGYIVKALYHFSRSGSDIMSWLETPLIQMSGDQIEFWKLVDQFKGKKMVEVIMIDQRGKDRWIKLMVVESDNLQAHRAARYAGADIVVVRNTKGNVMVCVDTRIPGLNLSNAVRMIRWLELPVKAKGSVSWFDLGVPGAHAHSSLAHWYYFKKGEQLFNGSQTISAPPTQLPVDAIVKAIKYSLHPRYVKMWCSERHIIINPEGFKKAQEEAQAQKPDATMGLTFEPTPATAPSHEAQETVAK